MIQELTQFFSVYGTECSIWIVLDQVIRLLQWHRMFCIYCIVCFVWIISLNRLNKLSDICSSSMFESYKIESYCKIFTDETKLYTVVLCLNENVKPIEKTIHKHVVDELNTLLVEYQPTNRVITIKPTTN